MKIDFTQKERTWLSKYLSDLDKFSQDKAAKTKRLRIVEALKGSEAVEIKKSELAFLQMLMNSTLVIATQRLESFEAPTILQVLNPFSSKARRMKEVHEGLKVLVAITTSLVDKLAAVGKKVGSLEKQQK